MIIFYLLLFCEGLTAVVKGKDGSDLLEVSLTYPGSGANLHLTVAGTKTEILDAIQDLKSRIVHIHITCTEKDFKVFVWYIINLNLVFWLQIEIPLLWISFYAKVYFENSILGSIDHSASVPSVGSVSVTIDKTISEVNICFYFHSYSK